MNRRSTAVLAALVAALGLGTPGPAQAAWNTTGAGASAQAAMMMPTSGAPTVTMTSTTVVGLGVTRTYRLTWPRTEVNAGLPVTAYRITRTSTLGGAVLGAGTCAGLTVVGVSVPTYVPASTSAAVQSCTDTAVVDLGVVRYAVAPVYGNWIGPASAWSAAVG